MWKEILKAEITQQGGASKLFLPERLNLPKKDCCEEARISLEKIGTTRMDDHNCEDLYHILWYAVEDEVMRDINGDEDENHKQRLIRIKQEWDKCDNGEMASWLESAQENEERDR